MGTIIIPIGIELLSSTVWEFLSTTFGDKNSQIPKSWGQKSPIPQKLGAKKSQKLGTKIPKSWGQKFPNHQKLGTKIAKSWGQKFQNSEKLGTKIPKSRDKNYQKLGTKIVKQCLKR